VAAQPEAIQALTFSGNGRLLAATDTSPSVQAPDLGVTLVHEGNRLVRAAVWRTSTGTPLGPPIDLGIGHAQYGAVAFAPDTRLLAASEPDGGDVVLDPSTGRVEQTIRPLGADDTVTLAFSPDGILATGTEGGILQLWNPLRGTQVAGPQAVAAGPVTSISFDSSGRRLATAGGERGQVKLWSTAGLQQQGSTLETDLNSPTAAAFDRADNTLLTLLTVDDRGDGYIWPMSPATWAQRACAIAGRDLTTADWSRLLPGYPYRRVCPVSSPRG
jgi:WD40 repeat protein